MVGVLLLAGLLAAWLRWGQLGLVAFGALGNRLTRAARGLLHALAWSNRPVRLLLLAALFVLVGWAGVLYRYGFGVVGHWLGGATP